ncbi:MAG: trigger factor [Candidatus Paceibacterota bacterium]|jgi:FKBP-type peptidyl-prolyl cis-trans isomerase (trigger factor)
MNGTKPKRTASVKELADSMVEIESELSVEELTHHRTHVLKHLCAETEIAGFRKGFVPEKIILEKFGEMGVLERAVGDALSEIYPELLIEHQIDAIDRPEITITKLAPGQPANFKIKTAIVPKFALPDYKQIAAKINAQKELPPEVSDKEIEELLIRLRYQLAGKNPETKLSAEEENKLPAITDEVVKKLGDYANVADFKTKVKSASLENKKNQLREKKRLMIIDGILEKTTIPLPPVLVENEIDYLEARFIDDLKMMGSSLDEYLKRIKKTQEELRKDLQPGAEKKTKTRLILEAVAATEKIIAPAEKVKAETEHILSHHKDADPKKVEMFAETIIKNELVIQFLENQK